MEFGRQSSLSKDYAQVAADALRYKSALGLFSSGTYLRHLHSNRYDRAADRLETQIEASNGEVNVESDLRLGQLDRLLTRHALEWVIRFSGVVSFSRPQDIKVPEALTKDRKTVLIDEAPAVLELLSD